jgi:hypothetical protein
MWGTNPYSRAGARQKTCLELGYPLVGIAEIALRPLEIERR